MKSFKSVFSFLLVVATLWCSVQDARAQMNHLRRQDCFNPRRAGFQGMQIGVRNATRIFTMMWNRFSRVCDSLDRVAQIISETPLRPPGAGGEFAACFYVGYTDTLWTLLDQSYESCQQECFSAGSQVGVISAQAYCAVSTALGGLYDPGFIAQPALALCGTNVVFGCKTAYVQQAVTRIPGCFQYTAGAFSETFENMVRQDCWVPSDVPIRGGGGYSSAASNSLEDQNFAWARL